MAAFSPQDLQRFDLERQPPRRPDLTLVPPPADSETTSREALVAQQRRAALAETYASDALRPAYSAVVLSGTVRIVEFCLIMLTGLAAYLCYIVPRHGYELAYLIAMPIVAATSILIFQALGLNHIGAFRAPVKSGLRLVTAWSGLLVAMLAFVFFLKRQDDFSRVWLATWCLAGIVALLGWRAILSIIVGGMTQRGRLDRRTAIVGGGAAGEALLQQLSRQKNTDLIVCGVFDDRNNDRSSDVVAGYPKLGTIDDLVDFARRVRLDLVIFTLPITAEERLLTMLRKLWVLPIDIRLAAHTNKLRLRPRSYSYIGQVPVLDVFDKPIADWDVVLKWIFDKVVGSLALIALSPVLLLTAIAVKIDSKGPVFFKQKRYGFNNELVEVYKFRSMYTHLLDPTAARQVTKNDPRVTRVGRFIRKTSLDELPQLFNVVFKSNLSLVGPRPHAIHAKAAERDYDDVVDGYFARHRVRPGITGWAQVNGWRGETDTPEKIQQRVKHDLDYIENWSIGFDLYILLMTPLALLKTENAY